MINPTIEFMLSLNLNFFFSNQHLLSYLILFYSILFSDHPTTNSLNLYRQSEPRPSLDKPPKRRQSHHSGIYQDLSQIPSQIYLKHTIPYFGGSTTGYITVKLLYFDKVNSLYPISPLRT